MNHNNPYFDINNLLGPIARYILTSLSRRRLPQVEGHLKLAGLIDDVEILRDRWGIPHIFAKNNYDLFLAQGFVHAQDRLWQMEIHRRTGKGSLSELFGDLALDTDRTIRTFGFNRLGQTDWANASPEMRDIILAYTAGINAFLNRPDSKLPVEFTLLRYEPSLWLPEDTMMFARVMMWQLSHAWHGEIVRARIADIVGPDHAAELEIGYPDINPVTLPQGIEFNTLDPNGRLRQADGPFLQRGYGSNAWAVTSAKSETGHPFLCNDMHLSLSIPALWYEAHLVGGDFNVTGVSLPGAPGILVGHNEHLAWGMTLAFTDCEDLFVEKFDQSNPYLYRFKDDWLEAEVITETIYVKGRDKPHQEKVIVTRHGPIISDVVAYPEQKLAVNSISLRPGNSFEGWLQLDRATNWDTFVTAMRLIEAPQLNVVYADVKGNIGYWVTGRVPIRAKGDGSIPAPGWTGDHEWIGEIPFAEMPHAFNPQSGHIISCNHRITPPDYPHFLGNVWMNGYRARYIEDAFTQKDTFGVADFKGIQLNFTCLPGLEFIPHLQGLTINNPTLEAMLKQLQRWDGYLGPDSIAGTIYEVTRYHLVRNVLETALTPELALQVMGKGFHPVLLSSQEFYGHDTTTMLRLLDNPNSWWITQAGGKEAVLSQSLTQAAAWLKKNLGPDMQDWQWGNLHQTIFPHNLGLQKPLDQVFNRGPFPIGGDTDTPCQTAFHADTPYNNNAWAPSFRQIIDLSDFSKSIAIFPGGQSGHVGSIHYDDLIKPWLEGTYHPMLWGRPQIEANLEAKLVLQKKTE